MKYTAKIFILLPFLSVGAIHLAAAQQAKSSDSLAVNIVNGFEGAFGGPHPGKRRTHAKGFCVSGSFRPSAEAKKYFNLELTNSGLEIPIIGRFSASGGDPNASDKTRSARGMALRFLLPDGSYHQMSMLSTPVFAAATPESFLGLLEAQKMDPVTGKRDSKKITDYQMSHPDTLPQSKWLNDHNPPASFAQSSYYSISTFNFKNKKSGKTPVRWAFTPDAGERSLTQTELENMPDQFLEDELSERLKRNPAHWTWNVTEAAKGDPLTNPTLLWRSEGRKVINMGQLSIQKVVDLQSCDDLNFDPLVLSAGIEPSADPILNIRSAAYAISYGRRLQEKAKSSEIK